MKILDKVQTILWDFDGVIMDSMPTRSFGFVKVLEKYPKEQVDELLHYHNSNGGLSRYVKFRYFFEHIRKESITEDQVLELANQFSEVMFTLLLDKALLIQDSVDFIQRNYKNYQMHIVSGSDGDELNKICKELGLSNYFLSIQGSPTPKNELVRTVLESNNYQKDEVVLIGDSINDYQAAHINQIRFIGYNNVLLKPDNDYIVSFKAL